MSNNQKALGIIKKSELLNKNMTLEQILEISEQLDTLDLDEVASWTFMGPNWVYKGDKDKLLEEAGNADIYRKC